MNDAANVVRLGTPASPFRTALANLKRTEANVYAIEATADDGDEHDDIMGKANTALWDSEWQLLRTPATGIVEIRQRALIVQELFSKAAWIGERADNIDRLMLDVLVAEILSSMAED
jgi:hypothetical protein